ncbi:MAG: metallopeptidase [Candidatus Aenigmarchaeota archaeon]|nr:metallopeptidase [Candidatus Aenigmarchaeota archaeon]
MIKYFPDPELERKAKEISAVLGFRHDFSRVVFMRSTGSKSRYTLARCHALSRVLQKALNVRAHYVIEVISHNFDRLSEEEKTKTIIHELMHIPKSMGGGFRHHDYVCRRNVEQMYKKIKSP